MSSVRRTGDDANVYDDDIYDDFRLKKKPLVSMVFFLNRRFHPLTAKLFNLNFHPFEVVFR